jgi:hypothetical protein
VGPSRFWGNQLLTVVNNNLLRDELATSYIPSLFIVIFIVQSLMAYVIIGRDIISRVEMVESTLQLLLEFLDLPVFLGNLTIAEL